MFFRKKPKPVETPKPIEDISFEALSQRMRRDYNGANLHINGKLCASLKANQEKTYLIIEPHVYSGFEAIQLRDYLNTLFP